MSSPASLQELVLSRAGLLRYWPADAINLGAELAAGDNATAQGGVILGGASGAGDAMTATDFDGVDDRLTTPYATRRNLVINPSFETNLTSWPEFHNSGTLNDFSRSGVWAQAGAWSAHYKATATGTGYAMLNYPVVNPPSGLAATAGVTYTILATLNVISKPTNGQKLFVNFLDASNNSLGSITSAAITTTGVTTLTATGVAPANTTQAIIGVGNRNAAPQSNPMLNGDVTEFYVDAVLLEAAGAGGTYFDGSTGPDTAWEGTANASVSSKGPFANGSVRTFEGWANRDTNGSRDALFGGATSTGCAVILETGSQNVMFFADRGNHSYVFTGAWPGNGQWVHWLVVFDESGDTVKLYINGAFVSSLAATDPYNASPGNFEIGTTRTTDDPFDGKIAHVAVYDGDRSAYAVDHWSWGISTAASRNPNYGLPSPTNFPSQQQLPTGDDHALELL